ncbi:hypothetical protein K1W54_33915, partial [Micromonospora sp. CPCC 205371]|nr:hypothetical protein [Micromonospora sp. CPCC 205371]
MTMTVNGVAPHPVTLTVPVAPAVDPRIAGVGTAVTDRSYSQQELISLFEIADPKVRSIFHNSGIQRRYLTLPQTGPGIPGDESQGALLHKHRTVAAGMGGRAVRAALAHAGMTLSDVDYLCCVTSTGFLTPGLSALLIRELGIDPGCHRVDVVGMGCNAGLNALNAMAGWAKGNPGRAAVMVCAEACSAAYVMDSTLRTAVVNSLFGDGAAAVVGTGPGGGGGAGGPGPPRPAS